MASTAMREEMARYFAAERAASLLLLLCAAAAAGGAASLHATGSPLRAMIWPLLAVGLIQLVVGVSVLLRTRSRAAGLAERLRDSPAAYRAEETERMRRVQRRFALYRRIEIALLAFGLAIASAEGYGQTLYAVGLGLMLEAGLMLVFDLAAERRGQRYLDTVQALEA